MSRIIVADSSANLPNSWDEDFASAPLKIIVNHHEYIDDKSLNMEAMLQDLQEADDASTTACPSSGEWMQTFNEADEVFGVTITSALSGCYNSACVAADMYTDEHPNRKVFILDSLTTGPEMELLVEKYRELIKAGEPIETIKAKIQEYLKGTHLLFSLESLKNMAKNGRVSPAVAKAVSLLGIRIIGAASDQGELEPLHKTKGEKRAISTLWKTMRERGFEGGKVRITHTNNLKAAEKLAEFVKEAFPTCDVNIRPNTGLCSYYAEPGNVMVGFEGAVRS